MEHEEIISTGHAAELCGVTRDSVLKWVKKGKVKAIKTAGGHFRIYVDSLEPYIINRDLLIKKKKPRKTVSYCWEYHSIDGEIKEACRECMIFIAKAEKCFLMAGYGNREDHPGVHCKSSCYDCEYFKYIDNQYINILIITENTSLIEKLKLEMSNKFMLRFSSCGYETATIIQEFRPDFIVIDNTLVNSKPEILCQHLINDPRLHGAQIVLAIDKNSRNYDVQKGICATINIPYASKDLEKCFSQLRSSVYGIKH